MASKPKLIIIAILVVAVGVLGFAWVQSQRQGTAQIVVDLPDVKNLEVKANGNDLEVAKATSYHKFKPGNYSLTLTKPGYKDIATDFTIRPGQTIVINISMQRKQTTEIQNLQQATPPPDVSLEGVNIINTEYFYQKTWAFLEIHNADGVGGIAIAEYDDTAKTWKIVRGPSTIFDVSETNGLPQDVIDFLETGSYLLSEEGQ